MDRPRTQSFYELLSIAIADIAEHGFDSSSRLEFWTKQLEEAAERLLLPMHQMQGMMRNALVAIYARLVERGNIARYHVGIGHFTIQMIAPRLRAELDRRIIASAQLIKLNRERAIASTLARFAGWTTSIPAGGLDRAGKREAKRAIRKALASLPFEERRVLIDQGHKLSGSLSNILATDGGAIALIWHSHWRQAGYDYREDHKERDGKVYAMRGNWALKSGLMKAGEAGYYDQITAVGEEVFCRCYAQYLYNLRDLPKAMLTAKGAEELERVRKKVA
jgi:hypothetical protein